MKIDPIQKGLMYLEDCKRGGYIPYIEQLALRENLDEETFTSNEEFMTEFNKVQKYTLMRSASPEFLLSALHGVGNKEITFPEKIELVIGGKEENGKVGVKVTPGSKIVKYLEFLMGKVEQPKE